MWQAAAATAAFGGAVLASQTQVVSADTLYDKVSALAAAVEALEAKAGGAGDLKCASSHICRRCTQRFGLDSVRAGL